MKEYIEGKLIFGLVILTILPTFSQFVANLFQNYGIGLALRVLVHIIFPIYFVANVRNINLKESLLIPLQFKKKKKEIIKYGIIGATGAFTIIFGIFLILKDIIDFSAIGISLKEGYGVTATNYSFIALAIIIINPFLEEYFWRGFVFRVFFEKTKFKFHLVVAYLSGILFSIHHIIIITGWFNWWQFSIVTFFLGLVGIGFNWLYVKTESIWTSWFIHTIADIVIVGIGFIVLF